VFFCFFLPPDEFSGFIGLVFDVSVSLNFGVGVEVGFGVGIGVDVGFGVGIGVDVGLEDETDGQGGQIFFLKVVLKPFVID